MIDPDFVLYSVVTALQSIPQLATELGSPIVPISASLTPHFFEFGVENSLRLAIAEMESPSIIVAYLDLLGGNFNGETVWKHRLEAYIRPRNKATDPVTGRSSASAPHLWWMMMNLPIFPNDGGVNNIRYNELANGDLQLMDTPTLVRRTDELGADFFIGSLVFPEKGDVAPTLGYMTWDGDVMTWNDVSMTW